MEDAPSSPTVPMPDHVPQLLINSRDGCGFNAALVSTATTVMKSQHSPGGGRGWELFF